MPRKAEYKPLLFTTTMRNPERLRGALAVLKEFKNTVLTDDLAIKIVGRLIRLGLYRPNKVSASVKENWRQGWPLSDAEVAAALRNNPQSHKEAGFSKGWPSRFATIFQLAKELGFVYFKVGDPISFSKVGLMLTDNEHPELERQAFLNALVRYQSNNPFRRVLNENTPVVLALRVISLLNADPKFKSAGISKLELPILLCWQNNDASALYKTIADIRRQYGFTPSWEVILSICDEQTGGRHASQKEKTIMQDLPDDFVRKIRMTGLFTLRGFGRFIDINKKELDAVDYVIKSYTVYKKFTDEKEYYEYLASPDPRLITLSAPRPVDIEVENELITKWATHYSWEMVRKELLALASSNPTSKDAVLKFIPAPLRFEFLTTLGVAIKYPKTKVVPHYVSDDEGLPSSHAPGNNADIECFDVDNTCTLLEVTLLNGAVQTQREGPAISRHLEEKRLVIKNTNTFFIAPNIHIDTIRWMEFIKQRDNLDIISFSIKDFISGLESGAQNLSTMRPETSGHS